MTNIDTPPRNKSSMCRDNKHRNCARLEMRCECECHGPGGQVPPTAEAVAQNRAHGRRATYNAGCRCEACSDANRDYKRDLAARASMSPPRSIEEAKARATQTNGTTKTKTPTAVGTTFRLVKEEPPAPPRKFTLADQIDPLLAQIEDDDSDWYSIAECITPRAASALSTRCKKLGLAYVEFRSGDNKVYVRRLVDNDE